MEDTTIIILAIFGIIGAIIAIRMTKKDDPTAIRLQQKDELIKELREENKELKKKVGGLSSRIKALENEDGDEADFDQVLQSPEVQKLMQDRGIPAAALQLLDDKTKRTIAEAISNPTIRQFIIANSQSKNQSDPVQELLKDVQQWA